MFEHERTIRPALAAIVVLCFLMPIVQITCGGQTIASISGIDLALGKAVKPPKLPNMMDPQNGFDPRYESEIAKSYEDTSARDTSGQPETAGAQDYGSSDSEAMAGMRGSNPLGSAVPSGPSRINPEPTAAAAFILAALALLTAFGASRKMMIGSAICAGLAAVSLFVMKTRFGSDIPPEAAAIVSVQWTISFWIALFGAAVLAAFSARVQADNTTPKEKPRLVIQTYGNTTPSSPVPR